MPEKQKLNLKTLVVRVIVFVMFGMLIMSFAIWGIGDIFRRGGRLEAVAEVGPVRIMPQEFQDQYRRELRRLQTVLQTQIDGQRARDLGIPQRVIQDMVGRVLFDLAARDIGVAVGDKVVRESITTNPAFRNAQGQFDKGVFQNLIYNANMTEDRFVSMMRQDLTRGQVTDAVTAGSYVPNTLVDTLYRYRGERRTAATVTVDAANVKSAPTPTDAEIEAFHKAHAATFTAPEYRMVTAVELQPSTLAAGIKVSDERLKNEYDARIGEFRVPEERTLRQILVSDETTAKHAAELLAQGQPFDKVAQDVTGKPALALGTVKAADVASADLAQAAFDAKEGTTTAPVHTPLGWHIVDVVKVIPGRTESFDEVKAKLEKDVALREAGDAVFDLGNKLQDALGGGATLEESAKKLNLKVIKPAPFDNQGMGEDGKPAADLPKNAKFVSTAFSSEVGRESDLIDDGQNGYYMVRVDKITPSHVRPVAEVRDKIVAAWQEDARRKEAQKFAAQLLEKARAGGDLKRLAAENGYAYAEAKPFGRTGAGASTPLPPELVAALFSAKPGEVVMANAPQGAIVAKLEAVKPVDEKADEAAVSRLRDQLRGAMDSDLLSAFAEALRAEYGVEINESVLNNLTGS